jgi:hypothetical protein
MKKLLALVLGAGILAGCDTDASVASKNLSQAADNFQINRRIVFYNGITNEYILSIEGLCSLQPTNDGGGHRISVICKTGPSEFKKHTLGLSHNVTYVSEQLDAAKASVYFYRVTFKPTTIIPMPTLGGGGAK